MSDIKFNISGGLNPYLTKLYLVCNNGTGCTYITQYDTYSQSICQMVENDILTLNANYKLLTIDSAGMSTSWNTQIQAAPQPIPSVSVGILGSVCNTIDGKCAYSYGDTCICFNPPTSSWTNNQCVLLRMQALECSTLYTHGSNTAQVSINVCYNGSLIYSTDENYVGSCNDVVLNIKKDDVVTYATCIELHDDEIGTIMSGYTNININSIIGNDVMVCYGSPKFKSSSVSCIL